MSIIIEDMSIWRGFFKAPPHWYYYWCETGTPLPTIQNWEVEKYGMRIFPWYAMSAMTGTEGRLVHPDWIIAPVISGVFSVFDVDGSTTFIESLKGKECLRGIYEKLL